MAYGDKRDYPKIDIYVNGFYAASTTWTDSLNEAEDRFMEGHPHACGYIDAVYADQKGWP